MEFSLFFKKFLPVFVSYFLEYERARIELRRENLDVDYFNSSNSKLVNLAFKRSE